MPARTIVLYVGNKDLANRVVDPASHSGTIRASYRSGYKKFSTFVKLKPTGELRVLLSKHLPAADRAALLAGAEAVTEQEEATAAEAAARVLPRPAGNAGRTAAAAAPAAAAAAAGCGTPVEVVEVPYRFFTPRECARLQGFPDSYVLSAADGSVPETVQYTAVGNAVAPPVIEAIARALLKAIMGGAAGAGGAGGLNE
jgi:site-specific DNA-cytosine methylase